MPGAKMNPMRIAGISRILVAPGPDAGDPQE